MAKLLIIDDVAETGKTLEHFNGSDIGVLYKKPWFKYHDKLTYCVEEVNKWVVFPYEDSGRSK